MSHVPNTTAAQARRSSHVRPARMPTAAIMTQGRCLAPDLDPAEVPEGIGGLQREEHADLAAERRGEIDDDGGLEVGHGDGVGNDDGGASAE